MTEYLTEKTIHVCGMNRCGQHGISSWLLGTFDHAIYKNNLSCCKPSNSSFKINHNPPGRKWRYQHFAKGEKKKSDIEVLDYHYRDKRQAIVLGSENSSPESFARIYDKFYKDEEKGLLERLKQTNPEYENLRSISPKSFFIFILRSPWNHITSAFFWRSLRHRINGPKTFSSLWIGYAEEFLGITNHIPENFIPIIYDQWFVDIDYRKNICKQLDVEFTDRRLNVITQYGGGSTFENKKRGQNLKTLDRWERSFKEEKAKKHLMKVLTLDKRMLEYSRILFGDPPFEIEK